VKRFAQSTAGQAPKGDVADNFVPSDRRAVQFAAVNQGLVGRHLTYVLLGGITVGADDLQVAVTKEQIKSAPNIEQHGEELSPKIGGPPMRRGVANLGIPMATTESPIPSSG
jgi:hypothetical protein